MTGRHRHHDVFVFFAPPPPLVFNLRVSWGLYYRTYYVLLDSQLQPKSAAVKDPQARREVEKQLKDLARQGLFITEASRDIDAILVERGRAW